MSHEYVVLSESPIEPRDIELVLSELDGTDAARPVFGTCRYLGTRAPVEIGRLLDDHLADAFGSTHLWWLEVEVSDTDDSGPAAATVVLARLLHQTSRVVIDPQNETVVTSESAL